MYYSRAEKIADALESICIAAFVEGVPKGRFGNSNAHKNNIALAAALGDLVHRIRSGKPIIASGR